MTAGEDTAACPAQSQPVVLPPLSSFCSQPPHTQPPGGSKGQKRTLECRQAGRWEWLRCLGVVPLLGDRDLDRDRLLQMHACGRGLWPCHTVLSQHRGSVCSQALALCQRATPKGQHGKRGSGAQAPKGLRAESELRKSALAQSAPNAWGCCQRPSEPVLGRGCPALSPQDPLQEMSRPG